MNWVGLKSSILRNWRHAIASKENGQFGKVVASQYRYKRNGIRIGWLVGEVGFFFFHIISYEAMRNLSGLVEK